MNNAVNDARQKQEDAKVEDIVESYFNDANSESKLEVLIPKNMSELCRRLVLSKDDNAADEILE